MIVPTKDSPRLRIRGIPPPRPWALRTVEDLTLVGHKVLVDPDVVHNSTSWLSRCEHTKRSRQPTTAVSAPYQPPRLYMMPCSTPADAPRLARLVAGREQDTRRPPRRPSPATARRPALRASAQRSSRLPCSSKWPASQGDWRQRADSPGSSQST